MRCQWPLESKVCLPTRQHIEEILHRTELCAGDVDRINCEQTNCPDQFPQAGAKVLIVEPLDGRRLQKRRNTGRVYRRNTNAVFKENQRLRPSSNKVVPQLFNPEEAGNRPKPILKLPMIFTQIVFTEEMMHISDVRSKWNTWIAGQIIPALITIGAPNVFINVSTANYCQKTARDRCCQT